MKIFCFLLTFIGLNVFAQFAIVQDKDGYVNMRKKADVNSTVILKIPSGEIIHINNVGNDSASWNRIEFTDKKGKDWEGFVHGSRSQLLTDFEKTEDISTENNIKVFTVKDLKIRIEVKPFAESQKKFITVKDGHQFYKGQEFFTPNPPKNYYKSISITKKNITTEIPQKELQTLFDVNLEFTEVYYHKQGDRIFIVSSNADGSDTYDVVFILKNGKFQRKLYYNAI